MTEEPLNELLADYLRLIDESVAYITSDHIEQKLRELHERIGRTEETS
jgi:hypothetical protein